MHHQRLQQLRHVLEQQGLDGYIVPSVDPYQSEYPPACYRRLEWLTGFTGSMGLAIVLKDSAAFFTQSSMLPYVHFRDDSVESILCSC